MKRHNSKQSIKSARVAAKAKAKAFDFTKTVDYQHPLTTVAPGEAFTFGGALCQKTFGASKGELSIQLTQPEVDEFGSHGLMSDVFRLTYGAARISGENVECTAPDGETAWLFEVAPDGITVTAQLDGALVSWAATDLPGDNVMWSKVQT